MTIPATANAGGGQPDSNSDGHHFVGCAAAFVDDRRFDGGRWIGQSEWSANADWASGYAPGSVGDAIIFAGFVGTSPNMDANYSITGLSFSNNTAELHDRHG